MKKNRRRKVIFDHEKRNIFIFLLFVFFMGVGNSVLSTGLSATGEITIKEYTEPIIKATSSTDKTAFRSNTYREKIKIINLDNKINPPANVIASWDIGEAQNGNVMAYITRNQTDNNYYDLYIQGRGHLYANENSYFLFYELKGVDAINNIEVLDMSRATNLNYMFGDTGYNSTSFTLDLGDNFDTSHAVSMIGMFSGTGYNSPSFTLNLGDKFNTSNVTNMASMFSNTGYTNTSFTLNLGDKFNTSNVTNMSKMFFGTGQNSPSFTLNLGDQFNTSNVTDMSYMFYNAGYTNTSFTLNLRDQFNTSNVTDMSYMFDHTGYNSPSFILNLGDKFNTSNVTDMSYMFSNTGRANTTLELDLSTFTFKPTKYSLIFSDWISTQKVYVKDSVARNWVINRGGTNMTSNNVLIKS